MSIADMDPQIAAAREIVKGLKELKPVTREILEQFGISKDTDFQGLIPLAALLYPRAKELAVFLKNMLVIQGQIMNYLETLGSDIESATKTVQNSAVQGGIFAEGPII